ncbi:sodium:alanine symporter family protein [Pseudoclavibacter chungangensis]|uniref:Sodium:alanine symporter family protein n=1 Tax=Pseudoclavibacter chungangensis TaxID=587635 RepID=A0A7J5BP72_9MICO|nr:sodium:alanine symporter family protein [Pseudoclavibacter chungangensis]KAB1654518.1 sodium:alanine symporter family protein [Pseudoclavibacter chungangensis]NYJ68259.1 AGCS family alanine or glycine:cation symporter [Pseudoclavibacter chungangensis]
METFESILDAIAGVIWGPFVLIPLLLGTGIYMTFRLGFVQLRGLGPGLSLGLIRRSDEGSSGDVSQYKALATALAATVGTGNIAGVATAVALGGPGAIFWMWVSGLFGMSLKYSESFLAVRFRTIDKKGGRNGGPQYYLQKGIKGPIGALLGWFFTIAAIVASFGIGNMVQANSMSETAEMNFGVEPWVTGLVVAVVTFFVLIGGVKSISTVAAGIVPVMIVLYIAVQVWILVANFGGLGEAFVTIFSGAFTGTAAAGGFTGALVIAAIQFGLARGLFSNESGMGSAAIAAGAAQTTHPTRQGLVSMTQTFIDTLILVTLTGLVITVTRAYEQVDANGEALTGVNLTSTAFNIGLGTEQSNLGGILVAICLVLFASTTLWGWSYYGERAIERALGTRSILPFRLVWVVMSFIGATIPLSVVWTFSDIANGLMVIPNLIGILILSGLIARETKAYLTFDPKLTATQAEIDEGLAHEPGYQAWRAEEQRLDDEVGTITGTHPSIKQGAKRRG